MISVRIKGAREAEARIKRGGKRIRDGRRMYRLIGEGLRSEFTRNMTRGVDPTQRPLKPPQQWTRFIRSGVGSGVASARPTAGSQSVALVATGGLRASMGPKFIGKNKLVFGFQGRFADVAEAMDEGRAGRIRVKRKLIRTTSSGPNAGQQYVRIRTNDGQWFTKRVTGGSVSVKPQARRFFFLSRRQQKLIERIAERYLQTIFD
jgi:hypothetical protein